MKRILLGLAILFAVLNASAAEGNVFDVEGNEKGCNEGDAKKCYMLGVAYAGFGSGTEGAKLFSKACDGDIAEGCTGLGLAYLQEVEGFKSDYKKAANLMIKGCDGGDATGCYYLGLLYSRGDGINQDKIKAYQLWMKLAKQGNEKAQKSLDRLCKESPWACK